MRHRLLGLLRAGAAFGTVLALVGVTLLAVSTRRSLLPIPAALPPAGGEISQPMVVDRAGVPLAITFQNRWNVTDRVAYHDLPELLVQAFLFAEDQRFFEHRGVDWKARAHAVVQNLRAMRKVRGASTITEQVVRILHPRPRTLWSRWLEGFEAAALEQRFSKAEILQFYLDQVPYAHQRRGVAQAARTYFDRDLDTLSPKEILALAVLVRSPSRLDLERGSAAIERPILRLARRLHAAGQISTDELTRLEADSLVVLRPKLPVDAAHFVRFVEDRRPATASVVVTTLDASLQTRLQRILDRRIASLASRQVGDGALLVADHRTDEILAWVNGKGFGEHPGGHIDKVLTPRQPGSALKPFVYALAMERGWTAATLIDDAPLADAVGHGLHSYRNYSRIYYGPVRLRDALGNSLNTPAVRAARFVGDGSLLERLHALGFTTLNQHPDFYGDGLALGNGEVTLFDMVNAYATLARGGLQRPLRVLQDDPAPPEERRIFDADLSSVVSHILSDPEARRLEFGRHSILELPNQTAVKTGTSNDYRDAWAMGYSDRFTVGVWLGNVDRREMKEVSGAIGPALVLRAAFAELNRHRENRSLVLSRHLEKARICRITGQLAGEACPVIDEWFPHGRAPGSVCSQHGHRPDEPDAAPADVVTARIESPTPGLHLALDPRIPDELEAFPLRIAETSDVARVDWYLDERLEASTSRGLLPWPPRRGAHTVRALVWIQGAERPVPTQTVGFLVK